MPKMPNNIETEVLRSKDHGSSVPDAMITLRWQWLLLTSVWSVVSTMT